MAYMDCSDWSKCTFCGDCLERCPVMQMPAPEAKREIELLVRGDFAKRVMSECTLCMKCNNYCPEGLRPYELILQRVTERRDEGGKVPALLRYAMQGMPPPTLFQDIYRRMSYAERTILDRWSEPPGRSADALYVGCIGRMFCHDIENSRVMKSLPKYGPSDTCCGEIHYRSGMWKAYEQIVAKTRARFDALEIERMVCYCGSCYNFLGHTLPNVLGEKLPFEVVSLYQWLLERLDAGELEVSKPLHYKAAIHESCYCSELGAGFYDDLRRLYETVGVEVVEPAHNRDSGTSCGAASLARDFHLRDVLKAQWKKYGEVKETGTRDVALNCPGCYYTLAATSWLPGVKLHYMIEEILRALGDDISITAFRRVPLVHSSVIRRLPLVFKKVSSELPNIEPGTTGRGQAK